MNAPMAPARLRVGIVGVGRVGSALGEALSRAGHHVNSAHSHSPRSTATAAARLPEARIRVLSDLVADSDLIVIAVPDTVLAAVVDQIAAVDELRPGVIVTHTAGAHGVGVLEPLARRGAVTVATHPAMTFVGTPDDTARLASACFGVTAADDIGDAVASVLVEEIGGRPVRVAEADRTLYHAALAHGANNLNALITDAVTALRAAVGDTPGLAEAVLGPLVTASLENVLAQGRSALTGPVARGDVDTVARHLSELSDVDEDIARGYRVLAGRAAGQHGAGGALRDLLEEQP